MSNKKSCFLCNQEYDADQTVCPADGSLLTPVVADKYLGTKLQGRYEILEILGTGGMGQVYKAYDLTMNRIVAIKMLHAHLTNSQEAVKRFHLEAQAASRLSLPNILTVHDFGVSTEGQPYMVMDYLEGISLADVLEKEKRLPVERSLSIFIQACAGLAHAHQKGVLHRDLKPSNIMLVNYGDGQADFVKIVDFGIAKLLNKTDQNAVNLTRTGEVYGSPLYMSPEQCRGLELDARSDLYSFGCVMYKTLTGSPVFNGTELIELLFKQVSEMPAKFSKICPDGNIPSALEEIVFKSLAKSPDDRYSSMTHLKDALEAYKRKLTGEETSALAPRAVSAAADLDALQDLIKQSSNRRPPPLSNFTSRSTTESQHEPEISDEPEADKSNGIGDKTVKTGAHDAHGTAPLSLPEPRLSQPALSVVPPVEVVSPPPSQPITTSETVALPAAVKPAAITPAKPVPVAVKPTPTEIPAKTRPASVGTDWSLLFQGLVANKTVLAAVGGLVLVVGVVGFVALSNGDKSKNSESEQVAPPKAAAQADKPVPTVQKHVTANGAPKPAPATPSDTAAKQTNTSVAASADNESEEPDTPKSPTHHARHPHVHRAHRHAYSSYGL